MRFLWVLVPILCSQVITADDVPANVQEANDLVKSIEAMDTMHSAKKTGEGHLDSDQLTYETNQMKQRKDEIEEENVEEKDVKAVRMTPAAALEGEVAADALKAVKYLRSEMGRTSDSNKRQAQKEAIQAELTKAQKAKELQHAQIHDGKNAAAAWVKMVEAQKVANEKEFALSKIISATNKAEKAAKAALHQPGWKQKMANVETMEEKAERIADSAARFQGIRNHGAENLLKSEKADISSDTTPKGNWEDWMAPLSTEEKEADSSTTSLMQARRQRLYASNSQEADQLEARKIAAQIAHDDRLINPQKRSKGLWAEIFEGDGFIIVVVIALNGLLFYWVMSKKKAGGYEQVRDDVQLRPIDTSKSGQPDI